LDVWKIERTKNCKLQYYRQSLRLWYMYGSMSDVLSSNPRERVAVHSSLAVVAAGIVVAEEGSVPGAVGQRPGPIHSSGSWQLIWRADWSCIAVAEEAVRKRIPTGTAAFVAAEVAVRKRTPTGTAAWVAAGEERVLAVRRRIPAAVGLPANS